MPSPFPGMDPYLEHPEIWPGFHNRLIADIQEQLNSLLQPDYFVNIEQRVYICSAEDRSRIAARSRVPDVVVSHGRKKPAAARGRQPLDREPLVVTLETAGVSVREWFLTLAGAKDREVVTILEVLSPANKTPGTAGRRKYAAKRAAVLGSETHLVELDLLRAGVSLVEGRDAHYRLFVSESRLRPKAHVWPVMIDETFPRLPIPLRQGDRVMLDVQKALEAAYERGGYARLLDYTKPPVPPLAKAIQAWAKSLLPKPRKR